MLHHFIKVIFTNFTKLFTQKTWINTYNVFMGKKLLVYWWREENNKNWGDKINKYIIETISHKKVVHPDDVFDIPFLKTYSCVGSVIELLDYKNVAIWGSGIIRDDSSIKLHSEEIYAVRGPLTRERLIDAGYECPEVYGDPALLMPKFYKPNVCEKFKLGIIPHYVDKENEIVNILLNEDVCLIDIFSDELDLIDQVNRCENIVSSSLHGLIVADAYGIPSKWVKISDDIVGDGFKFHDYYQSIGVMSEKPLELNKYTNVNELIDSCWQKKMRIDLDKLLHNCPFK